jgi:transposase
MKDKLFVGIDWGNKTHTVCVVDSEGKKLLEQEVPHRGQDVLAFLSRLRALADGDMSRFVAGMEAPHGVMVEALLECCVACYSINPKQLDRFRDRHSSAGAKDDDLDAYVLATSLRTDLSLFREIVVPSAARMQLSALSRSYERLTEEVIALSNRIRELLIRYYPQMVDFGNWHEEPWLWDLFEQAPTPARLKHLKRTKIEAILTRYRIRRHVAADLLAALRQPPLPVAVGVPEAAAIEISKLMPLLRIAHQQRSGCSAEMKELFESSQEEENSPENMHHDAALLLSLPGIGIHNGAVMLTEAHVALQRRDYQALRRLAGVAPVSRRTGGRSRRPQVLQRQACNHRLREATYHWGRVAAQCEPRARAHYAELRARGCSHGRAIRGVVDRLLKVAIAVLRAGKRYDPNLRLGSVPESV